MFEYILYFLSIVVFGDAALIVLLYFAILGNLNFAGVFLTGLIATVATDLLWYTIGKEFPAGKIFGNLKIPRIKEKYAKFSLLFEKHSLKALFYSKFVMGLRTPVRALYGTKRLPIKPFIVVNFVAGTIWISAIALLAKVLENSLSNLENVVQETAIVLSIIVVVTVIIYFFVQKAIIKNLS